MKLLINQTWTSTAHHTLTSDRISKKSIVVSAAEASDPLAGQLDSRRRNVPVEAAIPGVLDVVADGGHQ